MNTTDALLTALDSSLRSLLAHPPAATAPPHSNSEAQLDDTARTHAGALMRVNHVGEVCAQALYTAQALGARLFDHNEPLARQLEDAAAEEGEHLAWTRERVAELGTHTSWLTPVWYAGAFSLGLAASRLGGSRSLGFVVETERQVEAHLDSHLQHLPDADLRSRAIVAQMREDEMRHARQAQQAGAVEVPTPVKWLMQAAGKVMTTVAHRI